MRLSNDTKNKIRDSLVAALFTEKEDALKKELGSIAYRIFRNLTTEKDLMRWTSAPQGDFAKLSSFRVQFEHGSYCHMTLPVEHPVGYTFNSRGTHLVTNEALKAEYEDWDLRNSKTLKERNELIRKITAALNSINTDKQLLRDWPECAEYLPTTKSLNLPSVEVSGVRNEVNNLLLGGV